MSSAGPINDSPTNKNEEPKGPDWFRQSFGDLYNLVYAHRSLEAARNEIQALARWAPLSSGDTVLDVCCGNGRHLAAILELGCDAVGFDLSPELIAVAKRRPALTDRVFRGDVRNIPFNRRFQRVVNLFTSFGYFQSDDENVHAFMEMASRVETGGILILDHMNAGRIRRTLVPESMEEKEGFRIVQQRQLSGLRVQKRIEVTRLSDHATWEFHEDVRMFEPLEMIEMARNAGFTKVTLHGSFQGEAFEDGSERMILRGA